MYEAVAHHAADNNENGNCNIDFWKLKDNCKLIDNNFEKVSFWNFIIPQRNFIFELREDCKKMFENCWVKNI